MTVVQLDQEFTFFTYAELKASQNLCMRYDFCFKYESEKLTLYVSPFFPNGIYIKYLLLSILM